jgi:hypothetical protein
MHIITNLIFILFFLVVMFYFKIPNIHNQNYIEHKFLIFISLFCFQFVLSILNKIIYKCKINITEIACNSLIIATSAIIGYSLYNDLNYIDYDISFFNMNTKYMYINVAIIITLFISIIQIIKLLITTNNTDCIKY